MHEKQHQFPAEVGAAERAAAAAADRAQVVVRPVEQIDQLAQVSELLESVWGRNTEGVPINREVMRSLAHAGGCTTAAFDRDGALVGAAVLSPDSDPTAMYSLIAAAAPGSADRGIGYAVKLDQRAWALARGRNLIQWTFDPLVGRNARFNLAKLGAEAAEYEVSFYGQMSDDLNGDGDDNADRLVARWVLNSRRATDAASGTVPELTGPAEEAEVVSAGPDGKPMVQRDETGHWIRVPTDIVALRRENPDEAKQWRFATREAFQTAFANGLIATHMTRQNYYQLTSGDRP